MRRRKLLFLLNRLRFGFPIRKNGKRLSIVVDSKYRRAIKAVKYILTAIGLVSAFFAFHTAFISFFFGLGLFAVGFLLEKSLFSYKTMYVHPLPDFELESDKWVGAAFGYATPKGRTLKIPVVGWIFSSPDYAQKIHKLLLSWTNGEFHDRHRSVSMSVILHAERQYSFFCYPSTNRPPTENLYKQVELELKSNKMTR